MSTSTDRATLALVHDLSLPTIAVGVREGATPDQKRIAAIVDVVSRREWTAQRYVRESTPDGVS